MLQVCNSRENSSALQLPPFGARSCPGSPLPVPGLACCVLCRDLGPRVEARCGVKRLPTAWRAIGTLQTHAISRSDCSLEAR
eukprot:scaffold1850_cov194-Pinguiococcus_pyrenoidosus.AAC.29